MTVASLPLCKELYGLSGWDDTTFVHRVTFSIYRTPETRTTVVLQSARARVHVTDTNQDTEEYRHYYPAYSAGYLLRKLPHFIELTQLSGGYTPNGWVAVKRRSQDYNYVGSSGQAATPENALCQLAIELFRQGVLKKGE